jgi:hypothetical protein
MKINRQKSRITRHYWHFGICFGHLYVFLHKCQCKPSKQINLDPLLPMVTQHTSVYKSYTSSTRSTATNSKNKKSHHPKHLIHKKIPTSALLRKLSSAESRIFIEQQHQHYTIHMSGDARLKNYTKYFITNDAKYWSTIKYREKQIHRV